MALTRSGDSELSATATPTPADAMPMERIDGLGGSTCVCYKALILGKLHFVKELRPELAGDARMVSVFRKEMEIGYGLSHPGLPRYSYMPEIFMPGRYVVTEWIEGLTLDKFVSRNPEYFRSEKNLRRFIDELIDVVDYLHSRQILHLDIKPSNVMITSIGKNVKIIDLGYSFSDSQPFTPGATPQYTSPKWQDEEELDETFDFYSIGRLLEYIRIFSGIRPSRALRRAEQRLLAVDSADRITMADELRTVLSRRGAPPRYGWIVSAVVLAVGLFLLVNRARQDSPVADEPQVSRTKVITDSVATAEKEGLSQDTATEKVEKVATPKIQDAAPVIVPPAPAPGSSPSVDNKSLKALEQDARSRTRREMQALLMVLDELEKQGRYTDEDDRYITSLYTESVLRCYDYNGYYRSRYPRIPQNVIIETVAGPISEEIKSLWTKREEAYYAKVKAKRESLQSNRWTVTDTLD